MNKAPDTTAITSPMVDTDSILSFAIALGLGLLIGLQRERTGDRLGGIRTFPLIALFGALTAELSLNTGMSWLMLTGLLAMTVLILLGNVERLRGHDDYSGVTTEVSALLVFLLGAFLVLGDKTVAVAVGGTIAVLLHFKPGMHAFAEKLSEKDLRSIMQFAVLSLIILPILPNRTFGPYDVLNPFSIWLLVVLIVGISLGGYAAYKLVGAKAGTLLSGLIGGLISSTATTVTYARLARTQQKAVGLAALVILIASTSMFIRMFVEVSVVAPRILGALLPPLITLFALSLLVCALAFWRIQQRESAMPEPSNPAELKPALIFGALYALVILAIAAAKEHYGHRGIYIVALISGFTDVDAITLSTASLAGSGNLATNTAWRAMVIASLANLAFKAGAAGFLGGLPLLRQVLTLFAIPFFGGIALLWLWP
ncbi:MgtC/SapB family protein [Microbulbifer sp. CAU 1566]|uniref:MgtC/SapB family protein n=1 Tax=Microbulbifer sp. CAU 1566 TaxID=2933269 RepID=UPI0020038137|nr:MgtC/SapB family protein [Microbulbifer sp. CAU 1566]MCK7596910.1 MgtC/SapB family protein [Microbulbifer sp. CAU 1566]